METVVQQLDLKNIDKSTWQSFRFEEIAHRVSESVDPNTTSLKIYVGLEHIDAEDIHIKRFGTPADVSGGKLKCYPGDVVFGKRRAYQRKAALVDFEGICSAHAFVFRANPEVIHPKLFPFFLHSDQFMHRAVDISVGGLSPTINWGDLKHQEFMLPPKEEQVKLAELLWGMDEVVEKEKVVLEKFTLFNSVKKKELLLPEIRLNWENILIAQGFDKINEKNKSNLSNNVLTISAKHGLINQEEYFKKQVASKDLSNYFILKSGDFAYNKSYSDGFPAGAIKALTNYEVGVVSPLYICFRSKLISEFNIYYKLLFDFGFLNAQILSVAKEGARNHGLLNVSGNDFFNLKIPKPPVEYLRIITPVLSEIESSEKILESKITSSQALLKSLINEMF